MTPAWKAALMPWAIVGALLAIAVGGIYAMAWLDTRFTQGVSYLAVVAGLISIIATLLTRYSVQAYREAQRRGH